MYKTISSLIFIFFFIVFFTFTSDASDKDKNKNKGLFTTVELGDYKGIKINSDLPIMTGSSYTKSLRLILGYYVNPYFSGGIGFGADRYEKPGANTLPLFIDFRGYLKDAAYTPFVFVDAGKTVVFSSQAQEGGNMADAGIGYKFIFEKKPASLQKQVIIIFTIKSG